ncbi:hypothetical protein R1sor_013767 [Riccia sorocarpa]|uniref:Uncharacterized protein n=1 Tax=Riccia sorocarpa TaxID=122646 RepID=A0ABD3H844_9MARC
MIKEDYEVVVTYIENLEHFREINEGLTIEDKLNKMCPCFRRMDALLGKHPNITPCSEESVDLPAEVEVEMLDRDSQTPKGIMAEADLDGEDDYICVWSGESNPDKEIQIIGITTATQDDPIEEQQVEEPSINW